MVQGYRLPVGLGVWMLTLGSLLGPASGDESLRSLIPFRLLALLHAPEVHAELELTPTQVASLERLFAEIDGVWFRARNTSGEQLAEIHTRLEQQVQRWLADQATPGQRQRLAQLELRAQGMRCVLRTDVANSLDLTAEQRDQFAERARRSDAAQLQWQQAQRQGQTNDELQQALDAATQAERNALSEILQPEQQRALVRQLGKDFDTAQLTRVFPMAPELIPVEQWINGQPVTLAALRGRVVLVHFYAFQCHNCQANFEIYRRWADRWRDQGVVVLGIQTPETPRERDPGAVRQAAKQEQLNFPILIDLESANWKAWGNTMWPTVYVVDQNGYVRHWWQGELQWQGATGDQVIESVVERLLQESTGPSR